ncbi:hypothetical protein [Bacillus thuringiensis]|uniref:hypothetical protein n=1 Tax=Bacillus thuringiensis TaxID=1428 RepID=UPI0021D6577C|nr:hypothetical protein [Bacillus thuringiensis]MCU7667353.1 hypothetical protein [Bacillus thuringiensis]
MGRKKNGLLTELEKENPIGKIMAEGLSTERIIDKLKEVDFLTDNLELTRRGKEYVVGKLEKMDNVERIMLEKFILEHHNLKPEINYNDSNE